ncbi:MAG TPA: YggT family protein [Gammaproteobacteria bacterium]|jgi:YggT family protein|nr:YggT family protein [Gammaproteobacteria bacterium]
MASPGMNALNFLLTTLFDLYIMVVAIRFLMQVTRADYHNPISQFVVKATNPLLIPLRRFVPGFAGTDIAALVLCLLLILLKLMLFKVMGFGDYFGGKGIHLALANGVQIAALSVISLIELFFNVFIYSIVILAILSWIPSSGGYNPVQSVLYSLTSPVLNPLRKVIPPIGGLDISALVAIIALHLAKILVVQSLVNMVAS